MNEAATAMESGAVCLHNTTALELHQLEPPLFGCTPLSHTAMGTGR